MTTVSSRTDEDIQRDVLDELAWDTRVRPNEVGVSVKDGIVTLTGWIDSYSKKLAAEAAAHRVYGVKAVVNDIEVSIPGYAERTDADLAAAVVNALRWDAGIPAGKIDVTVSQGWVTLKGEVDYGFQKRDAERAIRHLSGIRGISNLITVKPTLLPIDLKRSIEKELVRNAETDAKNITVEVDGSKVILRGAVRSYAEKKAVEEAAWAAPGVTEVDNQIRIVLG
ncbi:BON domain-containing protein [Reticulibacter mediterranei]|uniref:BON domain-containing protein n=1 Tax=Reticulibacter mediterranei TaxID=2778369 RepID=A0A8J3IHG5_9CHLR|nr:BON domain-containing protein [Reticulibacter mediterranei]GHO94631.1 BON domain-containing protein [Reticulibacter mediterranei]